MPKPLFIELSIKKPCQQQWDGMTENNDGRFCSQCQKTVIDFTTWSDAALYRFFAGSNEQVCGRFLSTQLNKPIHIPYQPHSRLYRMTVALGLTLLFVQVPKTYAQNRPPQVNINNVASANPIAENSGSGVIYGKIVNSTDFGVRDVVVQINQDGVYRTRTVTNKEGDFEIRHLSAGRYDFIFAGSYYDTLTIKNVQVADGEHVRIAPVLKASGAYQPFTIWGKALVDVRGPRKSGQLFGHITDS